MTHNIKVTVSGHHASGKSAIAHLVAQALTISGLTVELVDDNGVGIVDEAPGVIEATLNGRITSLVKRGTLVKVQSIQTRREEAL